MINIICLVFPALFSVFALERLLSKKLYIKNFIFVFVANTIFINLTTFVCIFCFTDYRTVNLIENNGFRVSHTFAFLLISTVIALLLVIFESLYYNRLRISFGDNNKKEAQNEQKENTDKK